MPETAHEPESFLVDVSYVSVSLHALKPFHCCQICKYYNKFYILAWMFSFSESIISQSIISRSID